MFDSGVLLPAPAVTLIDEQFKPSSSQSFEMKITPSVSDSGYTIYIYDSNPSFDVSSDDAAFAGHGSLIQTISGVDNNTIPFSSNSFTLILQRQLGMIPHKLITSILKRQVVPLVLLPLLILKV